MGEAIETTQQLYPNLLERNPDLLFMLKLVAVNRGLATYCTVKTAAMEKPEFDKRFD